MDLSTVVVPMACRAMVRTSPATMAVTATNGVAVIAAGNKRSEQNHALLDNEFGGERFRLPYHRTAPHGALRLIRFANGGCGTASQLLRLAYRCPGLGE